MYPNENGLSQGHIQPFSVVPLASCLGFVIQRFRQACPPFSGSFVSPVRSTLVFPAFSAFITSRAALRVATRLNTASSCKFWKRVPALQFTFSYLTWMAGL